MNWKSKTFLLIVLNLLFIFEYVNGQLATYEELLKQPVYTSIKKALENPDQVYRLKLSGNIHCDTIPDVIFQFKNLQELTITRAKLLKINHKINELQYLVYLDISNNRLVDLPEEICDLPNLQFLIISRNKIYKLPENIGNLSSLKMIDAWDNIFYTLPQSITKLKDSLKMLDILQIPIKDEEYIEMKKLLPNTEILYTPVCPCMLDR